MCPYYNDDGTEINPNEIKKPSLCVICKKDNDPYEEILCTLNRMDQRYDNKTLIYNAITLLKSFYPHRGDAPNPIRKQMFPGGKS
jgi:hypothetical protein